MTFQQLPKELRPASEVGRGSRADAASDVGAEMIMSVIDRWRTSTMSQKNFDEDTYDTGLAPRAEAPPLQPQQYQQPRLPQQPAAAADRATLAHPEGAAQHRRHAQ